MSTAIDGRELRQVLGSFVTGVTVITTVDEQGQWHGLTANSFSSVSLDPPLILWSQSVTAPSHGVFSNAERFAVNILADDQLHISNRFARGGGDKFEGVGSRSGTGGVPLLPNCAAYLECRRVGSFAGGDHTIFLGQVERMERNNLPPLVFGGGRYLVAQPHDCGPSLTEAGPNIARLHAVRIATRAIAALSDELDETLGLGVWGNQGPTIVRWEESTQPVSDNLRTGLVLPVLSSATGLAFAAWLSPETSAPYIEQELGVARITGQAPTQADVHGQLAAIREKGAVQLHGTDQFLSLYGARISALSVPVFGADGAVVLTLTAIGATDQLDISDDAPVLSRMRECARALSNRLRGSAKSPH